MKRMEMKKIRGNRRRNRFSWSSVAGILMLFVLCCLFLNRSAVAGKETETAVILQAETRSVFQGEEVPKLEATAVCQGEADQVLEEDTGYTVQDLVEELNQGKGFTISCKGTGEKEGTFPLKIRLSGEISTLLYSEWFGKVRVEVREGTLTVKNPYGEWEGEKFRRRDGSYVTGDFITYHGKTYYFDETGKRVSGWQEIQGSRYYFSRKGVMKTGWMKTKKGTWYFAEDGAMYTGWLREKDGRYYFGQDGKMVTGEQTIAARKCVFGKDGELEYEENGIDPDKPMIALTFDDGPGPRTKELLEALEQNQARATFFMLGEKAEKYPDTVKAMAEAGCELGNHSYSHPSLSSLKPEEIRSQMEKTNRLVAKASGQKPTVSRPPYGAVSDEVKTNIGLPMILWSVDTQDWKTRDAQTTVDTVMKQAADGKIILMHDIHSETVDAAIALIPELKKAGFQLVTVSEMADARGVRLKSGGVYAQFP